MSSQSEVDRRRREVLDLQRKIAAETSSAATARTRAFASQQAAAKTTSRATANSKVRDFERESKKANDAEQRRGRLEGQLSEKQKRLYEAEAKFSKRQADDQRRTLRQLEHDMQARTAQFRGPSLPQAGLSERGAAGPTNSPRNRKEEAFDLFISHASEDKHEIAEPLADALREQGIKPWIDTQQLTVGDSLYKKINEGLANSRYGVVILSPNFFAKPWPQDELDGLAAKEHASGDKVILPLWHRVTVDDVRRKSPMLAGRLALSTAVMSLDDVVAELLKVLRADD